MSTQRYFVLNGSAIKKTEVLLYTSHLILFLIILIVSTDRASSCGCIQLWVQPAVDASSCTSSCVASLYPSSNGTVVHVQSTHPHETQEIRPPPLLYGSIETLELRRLGGFTALEKLPGCNLVWQRKLFAKWTAQLA